MFVLGIVVLGLLISHDLDDIYEVFMEVLEVFCQVLGCWNWGLRELVKVDIELWVITIIGIEW